eukprot:18921_1
MSDFSNTITKEWTTNMLVNWVSSLTNLNNTWKSQVIEAIVENDVTGDELRDCKSADDIANSFNIRNRIACKRVYKHLEKLIQAENDKEIENAAENNPDDSDEKDYRFQLQLNAAGKCIELDEWVTLETTLKECKNWYKEQTGAKAALDDIDFYYLGKLMDTPNKTLGAYNLDPDYHIISVKFSALGGAAELSQRKRTIKFKRFKLIRSNKPDCLTHEDDDDGYDRAEIGCPKKHCMTANTMYKYIEQSLQKNMQATKIYCPHCKCKLQWRKCVQIADMDQKEYGRWTLLIERRLEDGKTRSCPHCKASCVRKEGVVIFRMNCSACSNGDYSKDWCWVCAKPWKSNGLTYCGNEECKLVKEVQKMINDAEMITPEHLKDVQIPDTRACPSCLTLVKHKDGCKHMPCPGCSVEFCFVCLALKNGDEWPCNDYNYEGDDCKPYPRQKFT